VTELAIQVRGLRVRAGKKTILGPVQLDVLRGEHLLMVGPSGCGKTTLLRAIAGFGNISEGTISMFGKPVQDGAKQVVAPQHRGVGLLFQGGALWPHMTVAKTLRFVLKRAGVGYGERKRRVGELLDLVDLAGFEKRRVPGLSGGEAQRVALARALAQNPRILLLDEPLGPLDKDLRRGLLVKLGELQANLGLTVLHVTHDPDEAASIATRTIRLAHGRIADSGSLQPSAEAPLETPFTPEVPEDGPDDDPNFDSGETLPVDPAGGPLA
tara:strand:+ start:1000 stop:1806 length:807 start_codon:yes stop_codon:yes gene_type:complete